MTAKANGGAAPGGSRVLMFLRAALPDFLLVLVVSSAIVFTVSYGFYSAEAHRGNLALIAGVEALELAVLFWGSWSKRMVVPSAVAVVALWAAAIAVGLALSTEPAVDGFALADNPGSYLIFTMLLVAVPLVVYLLSRRPVGMVFLLFFALFACGWIQFMYRDWMTEHPGIPALLVTVLGIGALFVYQTYRQSMLQAKHAKEPAFGGALGASVLIGAACVAVGAGLFFGIVNQLGLATVDLKPFEDYYDLRTELYTGTYEEQQIEDPDNTSDETDDNQKETSQNTDQGDTSAEDGSDGSSEQRPTSPWESFASSFDPAEMPETYQNIAYFLFEWAYVVIPLLVLLALTCAILLWRHQRVARLNRLEKRGRSYSYRIWYLYEFLMGRFRRLRLLRPFNLTPMEFAIGAKRAMTPFAENTGGVDFVEVTDLYQRVCYGGYEATRDDYEKVAGYYRGFFKNARAHCGFFKWLWKFWRM